MGQILAMQRTVTAMTTTEFCMMLVMLFLIWHLWRVSKRIRELDLHNKSQWETMSRLWDEITANRKRIVALEVDMHMVLARDGEDGEHHE